MKRLRRALDILIKHCKTASDLDYSAQHDIIYFGPDSTDGMRPEEVQELEELGFHYSESDDCFYTHT